MIYDFVKFKLSLPNHFHKSNHVAVIASDTPDIKELLDDVFAICPDSKYVFANTGSNECFGRSAPLALPYNIMQWLRRHADYEVPHWSGHDLRKTARTNFSKITEPHLAEIMLGHRLPNSWQVYDHHDYLEEQEKVLMDWSVRISILFSQLRI